MQSFCDYINNTWCQLEEHQYHPVILPAFQQLWNQGIKAKNDLMIGIGHRFGIHPFTQVDKLLAKEHFNKAMNTLQCPIQMTCLGKIIKEDYFSDKPTRIVSDVVSSHKLAYQLFKKSSELGHIQGTFELGKMQLSVVSFEDKLIERQQGLDKIKFCADSGYPPAMLKLGSIYMTDKNTKEAEKWFEKYSAHHYFKGTLRLISLYANNADPKKAIDLFEKLGETHILGHYEMYDLACLYTTTKQKNPAENWYEKSARLGNSLAMKKMFEICKDMSQLSDVFCDFVSAGEENIPCLVTDDPAYLTLCIFQANKIKQLEHELKELKLAPGGSLFMEMKHQFNKLIKH